MPDISESDDWLCLACSDNWVQSVYLLRKTNLFTIWKFIVYIGSDHCTGNRLLVRWESRSPMKGHFSEKINMNNCIQFFFWQIWVSSDTFALVTVEKHLA